MSKHAIYIGFVVPRDLAFGKLTSFAGNEAEINFIKYVLDEIDTYIYSYSYNLYAGKTFIRHSKSFNLKNSKMCQCFAGTIINLPVFKQLFVMIEIYHFIVRTTKKITYKDPNAKIQIITCNAYPLFSIPTLLASKKYGLSTSLYLIDGFYYDGKYDLFRMLNETLAKTNVKKYNNVISLTDTIIKDFCDSRQDTIVITPVDSCEKLEIRDGLLDPQKFNIVFAGGIEPLNGIELYCEIANNLSEEYLFHIFGRGALSKQLSTFASKNKIISYHGVIKHSELMWVEQNCDLLIILRPTLEGMQNRITRYGIPYKLIEYMKSGIPVLASRMDALPNSFNRFITFTDLNVESVVSTIKKIRNNYDRCLRNAKMARKYMLSNCTWETYGAMLKKFMYDE